MLELGVDLVWIKPGELDVLLELILQLLEFDSLMLLAAPLSSLLVPFDFSRLNQDLLLTKREVLAH